MSNPTLKDADQAIRYAFDDATSSIKVSGTFTSTNAANGPTGSPVPAQATQVAGANPSGNLEALQTDASGNLLVSLAAEPGAPLHTIVDSSALPAGASTAANQTTANTSLSSIDTKTPALGQALAGASTPVVLPALQITALTPPTTVTVTQGTGTNLHTVIDSSALPTGAATSANQTSQITQETAIAASAASMDTKTPALGQALAAASTPVVLTAAQVTTLTPPTTVTVTQTTGTNLHAVLDAGAAIVGKVGIDQTTPGTTNGVQINAALPAGSNVIGHVINDAGAAIIGKVGVDQTTPGTTNAVAIAQIGAVTVATGNGVSGTGVQRVNIASDNTAFPVNATLQTGAAVIGALTANQTVNNAQINGVAPLMGNGVTGTGSQRVTIASDNTAFSVNAVQSTPAAVANSWYSKLSDGTTGPVKVQAASTAPVAADIALTVALSPNGTVPKQAGHVLANAPVVTTYGTPITSAAYTTIVASTSAAINLVEIFDSSGVALYFATGAAASEVNQFVIFPGGNGQVPISIPAGTRISYKAVSTSATGASAFNSLSMYT